MIGRKVVEIYINPDTIEIPRETKYATESRVESKRSSPAKKRATAKYMIEGRMLIIPPILHFSIPA